MKRSLFLLCAVALVMTLTATPLPVRAHSGSNGPVTPAWWTQGPVDPQARETTATPATPAPAVKPPEPADYRITATWPGPDGYNYVGSTCPFNWVDITGSGTSVALGDDAYGGPFPMSFNFPLYGTDYSQFYISSNGFVSFGAGSTSLSNQCPLPNTTAPNNIIALMWDDLDPGDTGDLVYYQSFASCPLGSGPCTVVLYNNYHHYPGGGTIAGTFEAIMYPSGEVVIQFLDTGAELGSQSTTGIEGNNAPADYGLTYACDAANSLQDNTCVRFMRAEIPVLGNSTKSAPAIATPGDELTYTVHIANTGVVTAANTLMLDPIPTWTDFSAIIAPPEAVYNPTEDRVEWTGEVPPGGAVDVIFTVTADPATPCETVIANTATITAPGALDMTIVTAETKIWENIYYAQDFEADNGGFTTSGTTSWAWGVIGPYTGTRPDFPPGAHSGLRGWATNLTGDYNNSEDGYVTSPPIDLSDALAFPGYELWLSWWQWLRSEANYDYASVEVRGGSIPWTIVYPEVSGPIDLVWTQHSVDISSFAGVNDFQVRFHFRTDSSVTYPGWYIDDITIVQCELPPLGWLEGYVYDYDNFGVPCTDAVVQIEPLGLEAEVDANGHYSQTLPEGTYQVTAEAEGYPVPDGPYTVTIVADTGAVQDFTLDRPDMTVDPTSLTAYAVAPGTDVQSFTITNDGSYPLDFEIREEDTGALASGDYRQTPAAYGIDPLIFTQMAEASDGNADFFIAFRDTADLAGAYAIRDRAERVQWVRNALRTAADRAQARVRAWLDAQGIAYQVLYVDNTILVHGDRALLNALQAQFPEISGFAGNHIHEILPVRQETTVELPILGPATPDYAAPSWDLNIMSIPQVWDELGVTGEGAIVANIDTGVYYQHPALFPNYLCGSGPHADCWLDPQGGTTAPNDSNGHGTGTMSQMAADNDDSLAMSVGDAPDAGWIACLGCPGGSCPDTALNPCFDWMVMTTPHTPHVVNNSWGTWSAVCTYNYQGKLQALRAAGILPVFAAGNIGNACNTSTPPANNPEAFAVGATTNTDVQASFSSTGPGLCAGQLQFPDVVAPGDDTCGATNSGGFSCSLGGTSFAAPRAAGCLALMFSANPNLTIEEAEQVLRETADDKPNNDCGSPQPDPNYRYGDGRVNCYNAVAAVYALDVPWVDPDPITGTVGTGAAQEVEVTFTCDYTNAIRPQPLTGFLHINHNDPCASNPTDVALTFYCISQQPVPLWEKEVWINGELMDLDDAPFVVRPDDQVIIVDRVGATYSETVSSVLTETWGAALTLLGYENGGVGTVVEDEGLLVWTLDDVAPNTLYPITKTFVVNYGDWTSDMLGESYFVEDGLFQLDDVNVEFQRHVTPVTLVKSGPDSADNGTVIPLTLVVHNPADWYRDEELFDPLPPGLTYAGNLTATYGRAWEDSNVIYWTSYTVTRALAPQAVLWDNGPLVSHPAACGGTDASRLQDTSLGMDTYGFGNQFANGYRLADEFTADAPWQVDTITFFAYQTGAPTSPSPITGVYYQIWDGPPNDPGSSVVFGDLTTNRLLSSVWMPAYRDLESGPCATNRAIMANVASAGVVLPPGTYWLDWMTAGSASYTGPWAPPITIVGQTTTGNALQYTTAWAPIVDGGTGTPQGMPFIVQGNIAGEPLPEVITITFDVEVNGIPGDVIRNWAELDWGDDWTTDIHDVLITGEACEPITEASFSFVPLLPLEGQLITFTGVYTPTTATLPITFAWDFGDSGTGNGQVVTHTFTSYGTYLVTLTVSNSCSQVVYSSEVDVYTALYLPIIMRNSP